MQKVSIVDQYMSIKQKYPLCIVLFRVGHFYEIFGHDAYTIAEVLNLRISNKKNIIMCGFPHHTLLKHISILIQQKYKIIICEESQQKFNNKSLIERNISQILTPGTMIDENLLNKQNNFIMSCYYDESVYYCTISDISTGEIHNSIGDHMHVQSLVTIWSPAEVICPIELQEQIQNILHNHDICISNVDEFNMTNTAHATSIQTCNNVSEKLLIQYIMDIHQCAYPTHMQIVQDNTQKDVMCMNYFTIHNLELFCSIQGNYSKSLFSLLNQTVTHAGARLLKQRLLYPLTSKEIINKRLYNIQKILHDYNNIRSILSQINDVQRALSRISFGRRNIQDLLTCINTFKLMINIIDILDNTQYKVDYDMQILHDIYDIGLKLEFILNINYENETVSVKADYNENLSHLRKQSELILEKANKIVQRYSEEVNINILLSINNNQLQLQVLSTDYMNILYSFQKVNHDDEYLYYTTDEISILSDDFAKICQDIAIEEQGIIDSIFQDIIQYYNKIHHVMYILSDLDVSACLAKISYEYNYSCPIIDDNINTLNIINGRHPLIEQMSSHKTCVSNDCHMNDINTILITGPNMSGKTTFAKQNAIIAYLAHIGSFVPADSASMSIIDTIFIRIGSNDDLLNGFSTFMVEMNELSMILNHATKNSFIVIDEIGRGTCAAVGESIARATLEYLTELNARSIITTHFASLSTMQNIQTMHLHTDICNDDILCTYKIQNGAHNESYAIMIACKAGMPSKILSRVHKLLSIHQS